MYKTVFNPGDTAAVISEDGRTVGGHDWGTIDTTDTVAKRALEDGLVIEANEPETVENDRAREAFARTREINDRAERARAVDAEQLREVAVEAELVDADDSVRKNELVDTVAQSDVEVPKAKKSTRSSGKQK